MPNDPNSKTLRIEVEPYSDPSLVQPGEYLTWIAKFLSEVPIKIPREARFELRTYLQGFFWELEENFYDHLGSYQEWREDDYDC